MRYEIKREGAPGLLYIEQGYIASMRPGAGNYAVRMHLAVRNSQVYDAETAVEWVSPGQYLIDLLPRQVKEMVDQDRKDRDTFCKPCFDFGALNEPPGDCVRCRLIDACRRAGKGDLRQIRRQIESGPGCGYGVAMMSLVICLMVALQTSGAGWLKAQELQAQLTQAQGALSGCLAKSESRRRPPRVLRSQSPTETVRLR